MSVSPTLAERLAMKTAWAALNSSASPTSEVVETIVFGLGSAGLLMDPQTAAELPQEYAAEADRLRALVAAMHAASVGETRPPLLGHVEDVAITRASFLAQQHRAESLDRIARELQARVAALDAERASTNDAVAAGDVEREGLLKRITELEAAATADITVYRAEYTVEGLRLGLYTTEKAAREHCDTLLRRENTGRSWDWAPDDEGDLVQFFVSQLSDRPAETTGYIVTPVTVAAEYDAEADE